MTNQIIPETISIKKILPNGSAVLAAINDNIVTNLRRNADNDLETPTPWRLAKMVVNEGSILNFYSFSTQKSNE
jgi:hypothetical protein